MTGKPTLLLEHHLKELKLPSFLREYGRWRPSAPPRGWTTPAICSG